MKEKLTSFLLATCICVPGFLLPLHAQTEGKTETSELMAEAASIVKRFGGTLKPHLKEALQTDGPIGAIAVCSVQAPNIAEELTRETGWQVKRVSLKPRNTKTARPDQWEQRVLKLFNERQATGEPPETIVYAEIVDGRFRFMKAQGVESICLTCHGQDLAPAVKEALKAHYPEDKAVGYSLGQIRGAFSLTKTL